MNIPDTIEHLPIDALVPYARNSRTHSPEQIRQICDSIQRFGFYNPIHIDQSGGLIAGHGRVMAARELGMHRVPCIRHTHLSDDEKRALVIADNKLALNAGWDDAILAAELRDLAAHNFDLDLIGFSDDELADLLGPLEDEAGQGDADAAPDPPPEPISKPGDVWALGKHRVMCGDSTSIDQAGVLMGGGHG